MPSHPAHTTAPIRHIHWVMHIIQKHCDERTFRSTSTSLGSLQTAQYTWHFLTIIQQLNKKIQNHYVVSNNVVCSLFNTYGAKRNECGALYAHSTVYKFFYRPWMSTKIKLSLMYIISIVIRQYSNSIGEDEKKLRLEANKKKRWNTEVANRNRGSLKWGEKKSTAYKCHKVCT